MFEKIVEAEDLRPVGILGACRHAVQGGDRRLQRERARASAKCLVDERESPGDLLVIPAAAILVFEED